MTKEQFLEKHGGADKPADRKLTDHTAELFKRLDEKWQKEKQFKDKVIDLFKRHNIGSKEDIAFLEGLAY